MDQSGLGGYACDSCSIDGPAHRFGNLQSGHRLLASPVAQYGARRTISHQQYPETYYPPATTADYTTMWSFNWPRTPVLQDQTLSQWPQSDRAALVRNSPRSYPFSPHMTSQCECFSLPAPDLYANNPISTCRGGDSFETCLHSTCVSPSQSTEVMSNYTAFSAFLHSASTHTPSTHLGVPAASAYGDCTPAKGPLDGWLLHSSAQFAPSSSLIVQYDGSLSGTWVSTRCVSPPTRFLSPQSLFIHSNVPAEKPRPARGG